MTRDKYYTTIILMLQGKTPALKDIPPDRLDWSGPGAVLELYEHAPGTERDKIIHAMGRIVERHEAPPEVIAEVIYMAASLDIPQIEPSVRRLKEERIASEEGPVSDAIATYLTMRALHMSPHPVPPSHESHER